MAEGSEAAVREAAVREARVAATVAAAGGWKGAGSREEGRTAAAGVGEEMLGATRAEGMEGRGEVGVAERAAGRSLG